PTNSSPTMAGSRRRANSSPAALAAAKMTNTCRIRSISGLSNNKPGRLPTRLPGTPCGYAAPRPGLCSLAGVLLGLAVEEHPHDVPPAVPGVDSQLVHEPF